MSKGFIALLNTESDSEGRTVPIVPNGWTVSVEDNGWFTLYRSDRTFFHLRLMVDGNEANAANKGVYAVCGELTLLQNLWNWCKARGVDVWTIAGLRADDSLKATRIKQAWREEHKTNGNPTLLATMAGFTYPTSLEDTESELDL